MVNKSVVILIVLGMLLTSCGVKTPSRDTKNTTTPPETTSSDSTESVALEGNGQSDSSDLGNALNLVTGSTETPSVFQSYHLELVMDTPQANDDYTEVINETIKISADVAGKNVHIFQTDPGMTDPKEGYIIGDTEKEYKLVDGTWEENMGTIALAWAMWPLTVVIPYAYSSALYSEKIGIAEVNGRSATLYELDTSKADPATIASMEAFGVVGMSGKGQVWIDKETGGMLKLSLDYTTELQSLDGSTNLGTGNGHIELELSKIGEVTVISPM